MSLEREIKFWLAALIVLAALLWLLSGILLPFVVGLGLAYLLRPLVDWMQRRGVNRIVGALVAVTLVVVVVVLLVLLIAPPVAGQLSALIQQIPGYVSKVQGILTDPSRPWASWVTSLTGGEGLSASISDLVSQGTGWITKFLAGLWSGGASLVSVLSLLVVAPVVAFYFVSDWYRMLKAVDNCVPLAYRDDARRLAREMDRAVSGFVRGQSLVCLLLGLFYAIGLSLAGLNFGLLIGLVAGLLTFIPYVGSLTGLLLAVGVAVAQFWPAWIPIAVVAAIFFAGQFIEGNILSPKLVGENIGLHPVWLIFALLAFGYLFGFVGLLIGAPLAAMAGVLVRFAIARYRESRLYTGEPARRRAK